MLFTHIPKKNLHHTNICIGSRDQIKSDIEAYINTLSKTVSNIEHLIYDFEMFKTKDAENIISNHLRKTSDDSMQIISIFFNTTNSQTQNKILKMLEEPKSNTYFFIGTSSISAFLPTIISRAQVYEYDNQKNISETTQQFLKSNIAQRLKIISVLVDKIKKEEISKQEVIDLLEEIEIFCYQEKRMKVLKKVIEIKGYIREPGASVKQLMEYVAVTV